MHKISSHHALIPRLVWTLANLSEVYVLESLSPQANFVISRPYSKAIVLMTSEFFVKFRAL